jgi:5'-nucleotidase
MFKLLASFEKWFKLISQIEIHHAEEAKEENAHDSNLDLFGKLKKEYDAQLTHYYDLIWSQNEEELLKLSDQLSEFVDELTMDNFLEKGNWNFASLQNNIANDGEKIEKLDISFQLDGRSKKKPLKIIHFNDVYNIEESKDEPVAGSSRFYSALRAYDHENPLILFSGDIFSPSKLSIFFEGEQMMPFLKKWGLHWATVGNHDFDFGMQKLGDFISRTEFPWVLSNLKSSKTGKWPSNTVEHVVLNHEGYKIALIGLAEMEWIETLPDLDLSDFNFEPWDEWAQKFVRYFKHEQKDIDFLIALTHMRTPRDLILAENVPELDLVLGGHDHNSVNYMRHGTIMKKSGCDFREFTVFNLSLHDEEASTFTDLKNVLNEESDHLLTSGVAVKDLSQYNHPHKTLITEFETVKVTSKFPRDSELYDKVQEYSKEIEEKLKTIVGYTGVELTAKFTQIRHQETNIGNMFADMVNYANKSDVTVMNSGTFRIDKVIEKGFIKMKDIMDLIPMLDPIVIVKVDGEKLHKILECGMSSYPEYEGKFPVFSGVKFSFNPSMPPFSRIPKQSVEVKGEPLDYGKDYLVSAKEFIARGKDGYSEFVGAEWMIEEEDAIVFNNLLVSNLKLLEEANDCKELKALLKIIGNEEGELSPEVEKNGQMVRFLALKPQVDGRLRIIET